MVRHHQREQGAHWRRRCLVNGTSAGLSAIVVVIFAVTKFTEGAWAVVVLFPLHRLGADPPAPPVHRRVARARGERARWRAKRPSSAVTSCSCSSGASTLRPQGRCSTRGASRPTSCVRCTSSSTPTPRASSRPSGAASGCRGFPLDLVECPDRRLARSATEIVAEAAADGADRGDRPVAAAVLRRVCGTSSCTTGPPAGSRASSGLVQNVTADHRPVPGRASGGGRSPMVRAGLALVSDPAAAETGASAPSGRATQAGERRGRAGHGGRADGGASDDVPRPAAVRNRPDRKRAPAPAGSRHRAGSGRCASSHERACRRSSARSPTRAAS